MNLNEKWMCYNKKLDHLIFTGKSGKSYALCGSYRMDNFPSPKWAEEDKSIGHCWNCFKTYQNNNYFRTHPGRETIPSK
jgi:hypothetical protein